MTQLNLTLTYNQKINKIAHLPVMSTFIGAYRVTVHFASFLSNLIHAIAKAILKDENFQLHLLLSLSDLKEMCRGIVEIVPILGGLASLLWDKYLLSDAQKLAYKIQDTYKRIQRTENCNDLTLKSLTEKELENATPEFIEFIHDQPVKLSTNQDKIDQFTSAFLKCTFANPIFQDPQLPFYALTAFYQQKIDALDTATILEFFTARLSDSRCQIYSLLDENNKWSSEAEEFFLPPLEKSARFKGELTTEEKGMLHVAYKQLPPHKRIFITLPSLLPDTTSSFSSAQLLNSSTGSIYQDLLNTGSLLQHKNTDVHLGLNAEIEFIKVTGKTEKTALKPKLGLFTPKEIKKGVFEGHRLHATYFPGIKNTQIVHESLEMPAIVSAHDKAHARLMYRHLKEGREFMLSLAGYFEKITGFAMTKEIWQLVDMVAINNLQYPQKELELFIQKLGADSTERLNDKVWQTLFFEDDKGLKPTLFGWIAAQFIMKQNLPSNPRFFQFAINKIKELSENGTISDEEAPILTLWKLLHHDRLPSNPSQLKAKNLKFKRIKRGKRKNAITIIHQ